MKTKSYFWLLFIVAGFVFMGVFWGRAAAHAAVQECQHLSAFTKIKCDPEINAVSGDVSPGYCATYSGTQSGILSKCVPLRGAICDVSKSPADTCIPTKHDKFFAGEFDLDGSMKSMYFTHSKGSLGCPKDYTEVKVASGFYDCVKQGDCCAGGKGYDEDAKPACCVNEGETCYHENTQVGGETLYSFVAISNLSLYMSPTHKEYSAPPNNLKHFPPKSKVACATRDLTGSGAIAQDLNTIEFNRCVFVDDFDKWGLESVMSKIYYDGLSGANQTANRNIVAQTLKPLYDCKGGGWTEALKKGFWGFFNSTIGVVVTLVYGLIMAIVVAVLGLLLYFAGAFLEWVIAITQIDLGIVDVVWKYLRDMANMFFILVLLYIAFCVILRIQSKNAKQMLPTFFAAVLLVNFSKLICQVVIDLNQILITTFYNMRPAGIWGLVSFVYRAGGFDNFLGVGNIVGKTEFFALISVVGAQSMAAIYMAVSVIVFFAIGILLAIRIVVLWLLTSISPLVYLAWSAGAKGIVRNYWTTFLRTAFFAPAMIFCMVLSVIVMSANIDAVLQSKLGKPSEVMSDEKTAENIGKILGDVGQFQSFMQLIFGLAFMIAGLYAARKGSMIGANAVVGGAEKWMKRGANWATAYKPAKAGLKALGGYGWRKGLESKALGGKLKYFDPKIWKQAVERRKKYGEVKARGKRTAELQQKIAGAEAFFFGRGTGYELAQLQARAGYAGDVNTLTKEVDQGDASTEELLDMLVGKLNEAKRKGRLGTEDALDAEVEALINVVLSRGDINDLLKDKGMSELVGNDLVSGGKAVMGADAKMIHRLFGDSGRAVDVANRVSEFNKKTYSHMSYMAKYDEEAHERRMAHDTEEMRRAFHAQAGSIDLPVEELQRLFYAAMSHTPQEINDEPLRDEDGNVIKELRDREGNVIRDKVTNKPATLYGDIKTKLDEVISHLPTVETAGQSGDQKRIDQIRGGVTEMLKKYQKERGGEIAAENAKKAARDKLGGHPGNWFQDRNPESMTETEKAYYAGARTNYLGRTVNTRDNLMRMQMGDAERVRSWAQPRLIDAFKESRNQEMLWSIVAEVRAEGGDANVKRADEMKVIFEQLLKQIKVTGQGGGGTEGGEGGGGGGRGGGATFIADPNAVAKEIAQGRATPPGGGNVGRDRGTEIDEDLNY